MNPGAAARTLARLLLVAAAVWVALRMLDWVNTASDVMPGPGYFAILGLALVVYAVLLAIPFVPGIEAGIMILAMQGPSAAAPVYLATLAGLWLAYLAGRHLPMRWLAGTLADLGLGRAAALVGQLAPMRGPERLALLSDRLPGRWGPAALRWRFVILALVLNLPGNGVIGGGGGIMLAAGLTRLFRPAPTLATIALAVAPVPLLVWAFDLSLF